MSQDRLEKLFRLLGSSNEHEAASALRVIVALKTKNGKSWNEFIDELVAVDFGNRSLFDDIKLKHWSNARYDSFEEAFNFAEKVNKHYEQTDSQKEREAHMDQFQDRIRTQQQANMNSRRYFKGAIFTK